MPDPRDLLTDASPLIGAARLGKLRLVRLLLEGGARVNERNPQGETPLLAACKALRGEPSGPGTLKMLQYLLDNQADPNAQDRSGRTALMWSCMERAGAQVASTLISAGADPSMEDYSGASALVYAVNANHQPTLQVLLDACRAKGRDLIIITTEIGVSGGSVTKRYLNVLPSPDTSPVPCMSPSDIIIKTGSPNSPDGDNVFNFRGSGKRGNCANRLSPCELSSVDQSSTPPPRQRQWSEPWLAIHNLAQLNKVYQEGGRERLGEEGGEGERGPDCHDCDLEQTVKAKRGSAKEERENRSAHHHRREISQAAARPALSPTTEHLPQVFQSRLTPETSLAAGHFRGELPSVQIALQCKGGSNLIEGRAWIAQTALPPLSRRSTASFLPLRHRSTASTPGNCSV
ncbi:ankyrin repeat domain-containing protein 34B isoform X2 [Esox lucius]|uniref:ankyrin repeat domain-containing protein 34B isoform X2 n=1 Tax=Esox lucius TaxID=8010 RepID=UPI001477172D|nr:ankyrin repeat domain-containing protein 34B isoform X2 [Esox lucius]